VQAGSFDQRKMEARDDILVYTSEPFKEGIEVSGPITPTLYVSSDAKDTDFTVKVHRRLSRRPRLQPRRIDPADALSRRLRQAAGVDGIRQGLQGDAAAAEHEQLLRRRPPLRIEVSSSNFPRFDRNLNTGGNNYDEAKGVVAHNAVHHSKQYPSVGPLGVGRNDPAKAQRRKEPTESYADF
jgi:predicted acyl esterase